MDEQINFLVSVKLTEDFISSYVGLSPEDIAYYFMENLQSDYDNSGVEFEMLEVY